ncbi:hypothetical protein NQ318_007263 [Aromia moschata]|uniref:Uncharacterized protein n=1 Tax=Aromia moschata TaxID=1265417 RepID=A0AAV8XU44_9CUCU|nr:hypothetical protein NQ318_007263 [Aromia moschata]
MAQSGHVDDWWSKYRQIKPKLKLNQIATDSIPLQFVFDKSYIILIKYENETNIEGSIKIFTDGSERKKEADCGKYACNIDMHGL